MESRKIVFRQTAFVAAGEAVCCAAMAGIFALLGQFDRTVALGAAVGGVLAVLNFFGMALFADMAANKAENQDVKGGQAMVQISYMGRLLALLLILVLCAKAGGFNLIALVLPLIFVRPILGISELLQKKGGKNHGNER